MSIETEFFGRSRFESKRKEETLRKVLKVKEEKPQSKRSWRQVLLQALLPGIFIALLYYHFFVYSPEAPQFVSSLLQKCFHG